MSGCEGTRLVRGNTAHSETWPQAAGEIESRGWREEESYPGWPGLPGKCQGLALRAGYRVGAQASSASIPSPRNILPSTPSCSGEVAGHTVHPDPATDDGRLVTGSRVTGVSHATGQAAGLA